MFELQNSGRELTWKGRIVRCPRCLLPSKMVRITELTPEQSLLEKSHKGGCVHFLCTECRCAAPFCIKCGEYRPAVFYDHVPCEECSVEQDAGRPEEGVKKRGRRDRR